MHLETLLYMLLQSDRTLPPPGERPDFEALAHEARISAVPNQWIKVPKREITFGLDPSDNQETKTGCFGWDNEKPIRKSKVPAFEAKARALTNGDYARYLVESGSQSHPASWTAASGASESRNSGDSHRLVNGYATSLESQFFAGKAVRTVYGPVPLLFALEWPVMASFDELAACAEWFGGRIPTMEEARSMYSFVEEVKQQQPCQTPGKTKVEVNG